MGKIVDGKMNLEIDRQSLVYYHFFVFVLEEVMTV